jgi:hypothetical protein
MQPGSRPIVSSFFTDPDSGFALDDLLIAIICLFGGGVVAHSAENLHLPSLWISVAAAAAASDWALSAVNKQQLRMSYG